MPTLDAQRLDIGARGLGYPQPVQGQQGDEGMLGGRPETGGHQQRAHFVAVQPGGVRLIVQAGPADMSGPGVIEEIFLHCVLVEPGDGPQTAVG